MKIRNFIALLIVCFSFNGIYAQNKKFRVYTVAFYNLENLFDTINGPNNDEEWLPNGTQHWTRAKYQKKLALAVKKARHLAFLPYVADGLK